MKVKIYNNEEQLVNEIEADDGGYVESGDPEEIINFVEDSIDFCYDDVVLVIYYKPSSKSHTEMTYSDL